MYNHIIKVPDATIKSIQQDGTVMLGFEAQDSRYKGALVSAPAPAHAAGELVQIEGLGLVFDYLTEDETPAPGCIHSSFWSGDIIKDRELTVIQPFPDGVTRSHFWSGWPKENDEPAAYPPI